MDKATENQTITSRSPELYLPVRADISSHMVLVHCHQLDPQMRSCPLG